jgi:hypothetical protein
MEKIINQWLIWCEKGGYVASLYGSFETKDQAAMCLEKKRKNGETTQDLRPVLARIDVGLH